MSDVKKRKEKKQTEEEKDFNRKHDALQNTAEYIVGTLQDKISNLMLFIMW
jgi:hypothetical protein